MRRLPVLLLLLLSLAPASAYAAQTITLDGGGNTPQTITVDGSAAEWLPGNLVEDDTLDTETKDWCNADGIPESPMDIGKVYVTNDNNFLYLGYYYSKFCFNSPQVNLGVAIDVNGAAGGTTDPFSRRISWADVSTKPDFVVYDVVDAFNYEILYQWGGTSWSNISTSVNPSWGNGSNGLGIVEGTGFVELRLPLSVLGLGPGSVIRLEWWVTQDGTTKGPLDFVCSDTSQVSTPAGTLFNMAAGQTRTVDCMVGYQVLAAADPIPPTVTGALAVNFPLNSNKQFGLNTNKVDVVFSEPVDLATAQTTANYALTGALSRTIIDATRDPAATNVVHLTLSGNINARAAQYQLVVTGVKDLANNTIVADGAGNVGRFYVHNVNFEGNMRAGLCRGAFSPADSFSVEGSLLPLNFALTDNAVMYDANLDSIYTVTVPFSLAFNPDSSAGVADLEWKFGRKAFAGGAQEFEPGNNRTLHVNTGVGAGTTVRAGWNNEDIADATTRPVDVIFRIDASSRSPGPTDVITLLGSTVPLGFNQPGAPMLDNGVFPDLVAGDGVYAAKVRFPSCSPREVRWKVDFNGTFECEGQGDRTFNIAEAAYDTVGGANGPQVLPTGRIDICTVTGSAVAVVFKVDMRGVEPRPVAGDSVSVAGNRLPLDFGDPRKAEVLLNDGGVGGDAAAGDGIWSGTVVFPAGTDPNVSFKYWFNRWPGIGGFECQGANDRSFKIDELQHSVANPQVRALNVWNFCTEPVGAPDERPAAAGGSFAVFRPSTPNPFGTRTTVRFDMRRAGKVSLAVYDISGRRVATLVDREMPAGPQAVQWDGRDPAGARLPSGLYLAELAMDGERLTTRLVLAR